VIPSNDSTIPILRQVGKPICNCFFFR
jgi:hypothetical protein